MAEYKTPGVYIEEIPHLPPSIASVETAIPAFIGYTQIAQNKAAGDLIGQPWRIESMLEYELYFGGPDPEKGITVSINTAGGKVDIQGRVDKPSIYLMYYSLQMFFINGGGPCYIVAVGDYTKGTILVPDLTSGLDAIKRIKEVTLLAFPDSMNVTNVNNYVDIHTQAIQQCVDLQDRFTVMDVFMDPAVPLNQWKTNTDTMRNTLAGDTDHLKYGAVYFPRIFTNIDFSYKKNDGSGQDNDDLVKVEGFAGATTLTQLKSANNAYYYQAKSAINDIQMLLPASSAALGVYASVDSTRGVWKAPANVNIDFAIAPEIQITHLEQQDLNVDPNAGKSINVIRSFPGRGPAIIWGARTLSGNDNEWRYISVRRFFIMVEQSVKNATEQFVFEPNDANTWVRVKSMIQNYLTQQWKAGALMGTSTKEAFFVHVGLGETMVELDVWEGRMIVEIGMAVVRPAEFIILRFMHKMLAES
ncbi:MAG: phage tail sheath family protein [Bacteroidetes bacterium]|nr:MAG: phage tail sheath family protein [Bacteroidota bacterium]